MVKGVSPPPSLSAKKEKPNCKTIDECEALQEAKIAIERASMADIKVATVNGIKYVDLEEGTGSSVSSGSTIQVKFKVLKAGKRSYDGLSGEGTVVFSDGYGLEDNEKTNSFFEYQVSSVQTRTNVVETFIVGVEGMKEGGGWEKKTTECDGGPGGKGNGGDIKTDMMIVPTAKMVQEEMCFDKRLVPFPKSYAEERRMAQRFDQALILEIGILKVL
ncbi:hypothetical protein TL16_g07845 [Triparma laevis f. inornata]|uniref:Uncharacterized protein n=1 Tax=Triparma laevis f. inornata TaxID=1714386 RepID=A0A9W7ASW6_9STRA|nr:hypothetical protein TL16_g07845 [Triparma laevis f. inornata]